jgi:hypothetical protein
MVLGWGERVGWEGMGCRGCRPQVRRYVGEECSTCPDLKF